MRFETDNEAHKAQVRARIDQRVGAAQKTMTGAFFAGLVLAGISTLALVGTWLAGHGGH